MSLIIGLTAACGSGENSDNSNAIVEKKNAIKRLTKRMRKKRNLRAIVKFPFDFPTAATTAKKGEQVLVPSFNWLVDAMQKDRKNGDDDLVCPDDGRTGR